MQRILFHYCKVISFFNCKGATHGLDTALHRQNIPSIPQNSLPAFTPSKKLRWWLTPEKEPLLLYFSRYHTFRTMTFKSLTLTTVQIKAKLEAKGESAVSKTVLVPFAVWVLRSND